MSSASGSVVANRIPSFEQQIRGVLQQREAQKLRRFRRISAGPQMPLQQIDGQPVLSFCSNDYLGLANHPQVCAAVVASVAEYGVGSGAAHLVNGHSRVHHELEEQLAVVTGRESALLFSTGYMANIGVVTALAKRQDQVFADRLNHASLLDAGRYSEARFTRFRHADLEQLEQQLKQSSAQNKLVLTDGVFSMDGDIAELDRMAALAQKYQAWLMVDDAHGFGVLGQTGAGTTEKFGLSQQQVPVLMATLGKALGVSGAFIAGSHELIEYLIQHARTYVYTTAMPPAFASAVLASLAVIKEEVWRREHLQMLIQYFRQGAAQLGLPLMPSETAIQPILVGDAEHALAMSNALLAENILVTAIRPPTVPKGTARLRVTLSAAHSVTQVDQLLEALSRWQIEAIEQ